MRRLIRGLVTERRAEQIVEIDLLAQPQDLVAVQYHLVEVALDRDRR
jgi:hypothetical protein